MAETRGTADEQIRIALEENNKKLLGDISKLITPIF